MPGQESSPIQGRLYVVALPIGNLEDITLRAMKTLESADIIAAEDTRTLLELTQKLRIKVKQVVSYHDHNEEASTKGLLAKLRDGHSVALTSDAGTPLINDPGFRLIEACYREGIRIVPVPGPSSVISALSICPIGGEDFHYFGFAPHRSAERQEFLKNLSTSCKSVVFETPHRLLEHFEEAHRIFGNISLFVGRELTKTYEEARFEPIESLLHQFRTAEPRGEFVLIYPPLPKADLSVANLETLITQHLDNGLSSRDIIERVRSSTRLPRQELYDLIQSLKSRRG